jgi:hypothetical protein
MFGSLDANFEVIKPLIGLLENCKLTRDEMIIHKLTRNIDTHLDPCCLCLPDAIAMFASGYEFLG